MEEECGNGGEGGKTLMVIKKFLRYFILEILSGINAGYVMECYKTRQEG